MATGCCPPLTSLFANLHQELQRELKSFDFWGQMDGLVEIDAAEKLQRALRGLQARKKAAVRQPICW